MSKPHRLTGIYLINTQTSDQVSGRFGFIDPQGGVSLVGENAAGKTTTLMILPYFFGAPCSWSATGGNKHPIEFLLPRPDCAIAFEYERGDDGKRLAVMRGEGRSPRYRIIKSGFRREFFVGDRDGKTLILDDDHLRRYCIEHGIERTDELGINQYQTVILGSKHSEVHDRKFIQLGYQYSYAGDALPNLNLLMSGIIKQTLQFKDLKQVIAALVIQRLGGATSTLKLPDMREITGRLAGDYEAVRRVLENRRNEGPLQESISKSRAADHTMALTLQRLDATQDAWKEKIAEAQRAVAVATSDLKAAEDLGLKEVNAAEAAVTAKRAVEGQLQTQIEPLERDEKRYVDSDAPGKSQLVRTLPDLISRRGDAIAYLNAITSEYQAAMAEFESRKLRTADRHAEDMRVFRAQRDTDLASRDRELQTTTERGNTRRLELDKKRRAAVQPAEDALIDAKAQTQLAEANAKNPTVSAELTAAVEAAHDSLNSVGDEREKANAALAQAAAEVQKIQAEFNKAEHDLEAAQRSRNNAHERLAETRDSFTPPAGSLQEFLLARPEDPSRDRLVRLVAPSLLTRTDLAPAVHDGDEPLPDTAYGLTLDLSGVDLPDWANPGIMESRVAAAELRVGKADEEVSVAQSVITEVSKRLRGAEDAKSRATFAFNAADRKRDQVKTQVEVLREQVRRERLSLEERAQRLVAEAKAAQAKANEYRTAVEKHWEGKLVESDARIRQDMEAVRNRYESEQQFQARQKALEEQQKNERLKLDELKDQALRERGADPEKIRAAENAVGQARDAVEKIEAFKGLVESWQAWIQDSGPTRLDELRTAIRSVMEDLAGLRAEKVRIEADGMARVDAANTKKKQAELGLSDLERDQGQLENLAHQHALALSQAGMAVDSLPFASVQEAKVTCDTANTARNRALTELRNATVAFLEAFVPRGAPGQVQDLLEPKIAELGDNPSQIALAETYIHVQRTAAANLAPNIWNTYQTLRGKLLSARDRLSDFRRQVAAFDKVLQQGMARVSGFHSLQRLEMRVSVDHEAVPWLSHLDHALGSEDEEILRSGSDLPPFTRVQALQRFSQNISLNTQAIDLATVLTLKGEVQIHNVVKHFSRDEEIDQLSSGGMTVVTKSVIALGIMNCIRGDRPAWLPFVLDEVGKIDERNFEALMTLLAENHIDVLTASPDMTASKRSLFARQYNLKRGGIIGQLVTLPEEATS